ncbi:MAG: VWA domain-containing protein [Planctomycetaceae bacterium]|jgi:hypothetical protein|nr:VWA domain-containing protein [Planctomycetaceae bacterium]
MSNTKQQSPNQLHSTKTARKIAVPLYQKKQDQQQDKKIYFILTIAILIFLFLLLLLFLSNFPQQIGQSANTDHTGTLAQTGTSEHDSNSQSNAGGVDTNSSSSGSSAAVSTSDSDNGGNDNQIDQPNEYGAESADNTESASANMSKVLSEENNIENVKTNTVNSSNNTQEASSDTKSIEPDKTTIGEKLTHKLTEQNTTNNLNFSLVQNDATLQVFGAIGRGSSFVFVFDRSGSMIGKPLSNAKLELIQALESLNHRHRFNIIFYDYDQVVWRSSMVAGTKKNKNNAVTFIEGIIAGGGTKPLPPLLKAISYRPDVIFFLTDGVFDINLDDICRKTGRTKINVIQFGITSVPPQSELLKELAERTKGDYRYINISQLDKL